MTPSDSSAFRAEVPSFAHDPKQKVLGADVVVTQLARLVDRELDDLLRARAEGDLTRRGRRVAAAEDLLDAAAELRESDAERLERSRGNAFALTRQT